MELPYDGIAWLCPRPEMHEALPALFLARRPELVFLALEARPNVTEITTALQATDAKPAMRLLLFEDGELIEKREAVTSPIGYFKQNVRHYSRLVVVNSPYLSKSNGS